MTSAFKKVAVFVKPTEIMVVPLQALIKVIEACGAEVFLCERSAASLKGRSNRPGHPRAELGAMYDLAIVLGGDGTMLGVARDLAGFDIPIIGVNAGRLGFITDIVLEDMETILPQVLAGRYTRDVRRMLACEVVRKGKSIFSGIAVNDVGISHGRAGGMVEFVIYVNGPVGRRHHLLDFDGVHGLFARRRRSDPASVSSGAVPRARRAAHALEPPHRAPSKRGDRHRAHERARCSRLLRHAGVLRRAARRRTQDPSDRDDHDDASSCGIRLLRSAAPQAQVELHAHEREEAHEFLGKLIE